MACDGLITSSCYKIVLSILNAEMRKTGKNKMRRPMEKLNAFKAGFSLFQKSVGAFNKILRGYAFAK